MPKSVIVKYVLNSTVNKNVNASYMNQFNKMRKTHNLITLKSTKDLQKKASVRGKELMKKFDHVRPNGKSYNSYNSGYGEVMSGVSLIYTSKGTLSYYAIAKDVLNGLMTVDKLHRDTELNTWSHYSNAGFYFVSSNGDFMQNGTMVQLFKL